MGLGYRQPDYRGTDSVMAVRVLPRALRETRAEYLLIALLLVLGVAILLPRLAAVVLIDHDDVISVIVATCNEGRYADQDLSGRWVAAREWQQFWRMESFGCFQQISQDLIEHDIHPPLYFWILHLWMTLFGVSLFTGLTLNLLFLLTTTTIIFVTCRVLSVSKQFSFLSALAFLVCLPSRMTVGVIRQYALLSLIVALLLLLIVLWLKRGQIGYLLGVAVILASGLLTQYQFPLIAAFTVSFAAAILLRRRDHRRVAQLVASAVAAAAIFLTILPGFLESVLRARRQAQPFDILDMPQRLTSVGGTILQLFNPLDWSHPLPFGLLDWASPLYVALNTVNLLIGAVGAYLAVKLVIRAYKTRPHSVTALLTVEMMPICTAIASWTAIMMMYIFFVSPVHAIGLQYLHFTLPGLFIGLAQAAEQTKDQIPQKVVRIIFPVLVTCGLVASVIFIAHRSEQQVILQLRYAGAVIVDSDRIGILPTVVWHTNPDSNVFAASTQAELLAAEPDPMAVSSGSFYYVSSLGYDNTARDRDAILERLSKLGRGGGDPQSTSVVYLVPLGGEIYAFGR